MDLGERLVGLLGKAEDNSEFQAFLAEFRPYLKLRTRSNGKEYVFSQLGFSLYYDAGFRCLLILVFDICSRGVIEGKMQPFDGQLPFNISPSDTSIEIRGKVKGEPLRTGIISLPNPDTYLDHEITSDSYKVPPYDLAVTFRVDLNRLETVMVMFSIETALRDAMGSVLLE